VARVIGYIVIGLIVLVAAAAALSIIFSIFGLVFTLLKVLFKLAVAGAIVYFAWKLIERVRRQY
jgi:hypothetical protein